jgi:hypothetical protein
MSSFLHAQQAVVIAGAKSFQELAKNLADAAKALAASRAKKP